MKYLQLFETEHNLIVFTIIFMIDNIPNIYLFKTKESAETFLINTIHKDVKEEEGGDEDYGCKDIFDVYQLIDYWNSTGHRNDAGYIYYSPEAIDPRKYSLYPELEIRKETGKYNL